MMRPRRRKAPLSSFPLRRNYLRHPCKMLLRFGTVTRRELWDGLRMLSAVLAYAGLSQSAERAGDLNAEVAPPRPRTCQGGRPAPAERVEDIPAGHRQVADDVLDHVQGLGHGVL